MASARATTVRDASGDPAPDASVQFLATSGQLDEWPDDHDGMPAAANIFALYGGLTPATYQLSPAWQ